VIILESKKRQKKGTQKNLRRKKKGKANRRVSLNRYKTYMGMAVILSQWRKEGRCQIVLRVVDAPLNSFCKYKVTAQVEAFGCCRKSCTITRNERAF